MEFRMELELRQKTEKTESDMLNDSELQILSFKVFHILQDKRVKIFDIPIFVESEHHSELSNLPM